jgi:hypothetical protein
MGLNIRLHNITAPNDFNLFLKTGATPGDVSVGFTQYGGLFTAGTTEVIISGTTKNFIQFDTQYWIKVQYTGTTNDVKYYIEGIKTHDSKYYECYDTINFSYIVTGNTFDSPLSSDNFNVKVTLIDNTSPYGNNSSIVNGNHHAYGIYTGTTLYSFSGGTATKIADTTGTTAMVINGTDSTLDGTTKNVIYQISLTQPSEFYVFVVHGDGWNLNAKNQGGFDVKKVKVVNSYVP